MRVLALLCFVFALASPAAAQTPIDVVKSFYTREFSDENRDMPLSRRLAALKARAESASEKFGRAMAGLNLEWPTGLPSLPGDGRDREPAAEWRTTARFAELKRGGGRATIQATFRLFGDGGATELHYSMAREKGRWVVDDIRYVGDKETLSRLLRSGARGERL